MDNTFEALQDLYDIIEKCERRNVKLPEEVIRQINEAEENIIRDEILPIIGKDIEPTLSQIKRDLVLVVEYNPGEPVSVALSRKTKISQIDDAKPIVANTQKVSKPVKSDEAYSVAEPHEPIKTVTNHTKGLRVTFPDGTVVCNKTAIDTEIDVFRRIGFERLERGIMRPELKGEDVKRYEPLRNSYWLIYPHHQVNGKTVPYEEHEMQELFPLTYEYLLPYKKELIEKKIRYKTNPKYWYALHRSRDIQMFEQLKIITAEISYGCNMTLDTKGLFHNTKCYTILLKGNFNGKELAYLGLFNSKIMWYFLSETGYVLRGGFFCFKTKYLEPFPIPEIPDDVADLLSKKVQTVLDAKSVDITAETKTIENEINLLVYHLYGLTYDEALVVDPETSITRQEYERD